MINKVIIEGCLSNKYSLHKSKEIINHKNIEYIIFYIGTIQKNNKIVYIKAKTYIKKIMNELLYNNDYYCNNIFSFEGKLIYANKALMFIVQDIHLIFKND